MIVKCTKTGKILATEDEMKEHAEAFGVASFEEIQPDTTMIWMNPSTGKYCFSKNEMDVFCKRTGQDTAAFIEILVTEFLQVRSEKLKASRNDPKVERFANEKMLAALIDLKGFTALQAEKALWYTRNESVTKAVEWLRAHSSDSDFNMPLKPGDDEETPESLTKQPEPTVTQTVNLEEYVNKDTLKELLSMGFNRERSVRAIWKTENGDVSKCVDWLTEHAQDTDIDRPSPETISLTSGKKGPSISREDAQAAALELQKKVREQRALREANDAREKERQRIANTKAMQEQQAVMEEQKRKREIMERDRIKREEEAHRAELAQKLKLDYIERFGCEPPSSAQQQGSGPSANAKPKDKILWYLNQIKKRHSSDVVINCFKTLRIYLSNIASNCAEKKYHKIKTTNKVFSEKVAPVPESLELLAVVGFEKSELEPEVIEIETSVADGYLCSQAVQYIDVILNQL